MHTWQGVLLVPSQALVFWLLSSWRDGDSIEQYRIKSPGCSFPNPWQGQDFESGQQSVTSQHSSHGWSAAGEGILCVAGDEEL